MPREEGTMGWTRRSYDALYDWLDPKTRPAAKRVLLSNELDDVVKRLEAADNLGVWYQITKEAAEAVGPDVVEHSAQAARFELKKLP